MAGITCDFFSESLGVSVTINVILPEKNRNIGIANRKIKKSFPPVLYLLHGYSDNHSIWTRMTSIERYAQEAGIAVIMPAVNLSYYANTKTGYKYWEYLSHELPIVVNQLFRISQKRENTFVAGLSMGGYGAYKLALSFPEKFAAAGSFSGSLDIYSIYTKATDPNIKKTLVDAFGKAKELMGSDNDLYTLAYNLKKQKKIQLPKFYQCCGTNDFLYEDNMRFKNFMLEYKFDLFYEEEPEAEHTWDYWDRSVKRFISLISEL